MSRLTATSSARGLPSAGSGWCLRRTRRRSAGRAVDRSPSGARRHRPARRGDVERWSSPRPPRRRYAGLQARSRPAWPHELVHDVADTATLEADPLQVVDHQPRDRGERERGKRGDRSDHSQCCLRHIWLTQPRCRSALLDKSASNGTNSWTSGPGPAGRCCRSSLAWCRPPGSDTRRERTLPGTCELVLWG
jgi:hypothetical protein